MYINVFDVKICMFCSVTCARIPATAENGNKISKQTMPCFTCVAIC